jgi:hypothetical protein
MEYKTGTLTIFLLSHQQEILRKNAKIAPEEAEKLTLKGYRQKYPKDSVQAYS